MTDDNNPFRPALAQPVDDTVLANDPAADNFLAGNDNLGNQVQRNMDGVIASPTMPQQAAPAPRLDQMGQTDGNTAQNGTDLANAAPYDPLSMTNNASLTSDNSSDADLSSLLGTSPTQIE